MTSPKTHDMPYLNFMATINMASIPQWHQRIADIFCMFKKELLASFMELQVHILIPLVDEVQLVGIISYYWMFLEI